jgi:ABC-2 type transport system permease protein
MLRALKGELFKLRRAPMVLWTLLTVALVPAVSAGSVKTMDADLHVTWDSFMRLGPQMMASWWGILIFGLATSYLFGREFFDGTAKNMLTLPIRRETFVVAKFVVLALWVAALTVLSVVMQAAFASVLGVPGFAWAPIWRSASQSFQIAGLIYLTLPVVAALATLEKGYLPPMMFSAFMATAAFMVAAIGWGRWFPWSMVLAPAGSSFGPLFDAPVLTAVSWVIDSAVFAAGVLVVLVYIDRADNTQ